MYSEKVRSVLCPVDLTEESVQAVMYAQFIANEFQARLTLVHFLPRPSLMDIGYNTVDAEQRIRQEELLSLGIMRDMYEGYIDPEHTEFHVTTGDVTVSTLQKADDLDADLIVVGTSDSKGLLSRLVISEIYGIIKNAACPVITCKYGLTKSGQLRKILIPVPESFDLDDLKHFLINNFSQTQFELTLLSIADVNSSESNLIEKRKKLDEFKNEIQKDIEGKIHLDIIKFPRPWEGVLRYCEFKEADMLVFMHQATEGISRIIYSSNTQKVIRNATIPVMTIKNDKNVPHREYFQKWYLI